MKVKKWLWGILIILTCSLGLIFYWHYRPSLVELGPGLWNDFLRQSLFRSFVHKNRWYEGTIKAKVGLLSESQTGSIISIGGVLGFGISNQQSFYHYKGDIGPYNLNMDRLHETNEHYVRSSHVLISGVVSNSFLTELLGSLSQTNGQFVHLQGFASRDRLQYIIDPRSVFTLLSGAIFVDYEHCEGLSRCPLIIDTDFLPDKSKLSPNPIVAFFQELQEQTAWFYPREGWISIDLLQSRASSVSGKISKNSIELMWNRQGITNKVVNIKHEIHDNTHVIRFDQEQDGELGQSWKILYDVYPDGVNVTINSLLSGKTLDLKGNRYDVGAFVPVDKGRPLDIYGLLGN